MLSFAVKETSGIYEDAPAPVFMCIRDLTSTWQPEKGDEGQRLRAIACGSPLTDGNPHLQHVAKARRGSRLGDDRSTVR